MGVSDGGSGEPPGNTVGFGNQIASGNFPMTLSTTPDGGALLRVRVDNRHPFTRLMRRDGNMHDKGRLSAATLLAEKSNLLHRVLTQLRHDFTTP